MFNNIGRKIMGLAKLFCWLGIIASIIGGILIIATGLLSANSYYTSKYSIYTILCGLAVIIFGSLLAWISSFLLYGFGQLVDNSDKLVMKEKRSRYQD